MRFSIIYRKELLETMRDRRTLVFMLLLPTVLTPLIIFGATRLAMRIQRQQAVETVHVVADANSRAAWEALVQTWFVGTDLGKGIESMQSPFMRALVKPDKLKEFDKIPAGITTDPKAFAKWTKDLSSAAREEISSVEERVKDAPPNIPADVRDKAMEFHSIALKSLGMIEFVDPSELAQPPPDWQAPEIPESLRELPHIREVAFAMSEGTVQGMLVVPSSLEQVRQSDWESMQVTFVLDSRSGLSSEASARIRHTVDAARETVATERLKRHGLPEATLQPIRMREETDLATMSQRVLHQVGGMLPYVILAFAFMGAMYPALDLGSGEKERLTLETLLLSPCSRTEIAVGKFFVILTTSLCAATLGVTSLVVSVKTMVPPAVLEYLDLRVETGAWGLVALLIIPAATLFSGVFLAVSIFARSFREAQSYLVPFQFVLILPAAAPLIPGLELDWKLAMMPMVNVSLMARNCLTGDVNWLYFALTMVSSWTTAALCIGACVWMFGREKVLFRS